MAKKSPISKRLKQARLKAKLSQKQLGIAIGIDQFVASPRMNQYETGKHMPDFDVVKKIAEVLSVPPSFFYTIEDDLAELIKLYGNFNKKEQRQLINFAKQFAK